MFKKNVSVTGFGIGHFINATTGAAVTTGTPTCKRTLDGTGGACANAASYNTDGAVWEIDLDAADMNGDVVVLSFTLTDCLPISYTIRTSTKLVSELNDYAGGDTSGTTTLLTRFSEARAGALTDWIDGGRLDLLLDAIKAKTDLGLLNTTWTDAKAGYLDEAISAAKTLTAAYDAAKTAAAAGAAMALTSGERTTLAAAIEAAIINELDGTAVMQAIADLIASDMTTGDLSVVAIATATRDAILNRVLAGNHDTASTAGLLLQYLDATISSRHASGAAVAKSPATLDWSADVSNKPTIGTSTFNPATDTVANVTTVATCTTNTDMRGTDSAALAATALSTDVWTNTKAGYLDAAISNIPTNPMRDTEDGTSFTAIPNMATATNQSTIAGYIDTEVGTIIEHLTDIKGTGFAKDTHSLPQCLTAAGFSTFNAASDKVYLANGAHGGAAASITLADYSDFQGAAGTDASTIYTYFTAESRQNAFKADVTGLALEATLTAMKGSEWTDETLKAIKDAIDLLEAGAAPTVEEVADEVYAAGRAFPALNLANAPTGATASYTVSRATIGSLGSLDVERWQYEALGSFEFDVETAPTTPLSFVAWLPGRPGTAIFRLSSEDGDITVDGTTVTVAADDTYMEDVTTYRWTLDDATDAAIAEGTITVKARPTPEAPAE